MKINLELETMISEQLVGRGINDKRVLNAFRKVPRDYFAPPYLKPKAFMDLQIPIGVGQSIERPYISARMLQEARIPEGGRVLEIGTGGGFQTTLLSTFVDQIFTVEHYPELSAKARARLTGEMGLKGIEFHVGDGWVGWSEQAPFDAIIVNVACPEVPEDLEGQLRIGGYLVVPVGEEQQQLMVVHRKDDDIWERTQLPEEIFLSEFQPIIRDDDDFF